MNILWCHQVLDHIGGTYLYPSISTDSVGQSVPNLAHSNLQQIDYANFWSYARLPVTFDVLKLTLHLGKNLFVHESLPESEKLFQDHVSAKYMQLKFIFINTTKAEDPWVII